MANDNGHSSGNGFAASNGNGFHRPNGQTGSPETTAPSSPHGKHSNGNGLKKKEDVASDLTDMLGRLNIGNIEPYDGTLPPKLSLGDHPQADKVLADTNVYPLKTVATPVWHYHLEFTRQYTANGQVKTAPTVPPEEKKLGDFFLVKSREEHRQLLRLFVQKYPDVFGKSHDAFCFDYRHDLFSLFEMNVPDENVMGLTPEELGSLYVKPCSVKLAIKIPQTNHVLNVKDFPEVFSGDLSENNVVRFLEMGTSHYATENPEEHLTYESKRSYFLALEKFGFNERMACPSLGDGKYLAVGANKTVIRIDEGEGPAVVVDSKKTPFLATMNLLQMACQVLKVDHSTVINNRQLEMLRDYFKRVAVSPKHLENVTFPISTFSDEDANGLMFENRDNVSTSVYDYFASTYGIRLQHPQWPLVVRKQGDRKSYFPMEILTVADNQRVGKNQITPRDIATIVKSCAVPPVVKQSDCRKGFNAFNINGDGFAHGANIAATPQSLKIQAKILKAPVINYVNGGVKAEDNGKWRLPKQAKYVSIKTRSVRWASVFIKSSGDVEGLMREFARRFERECQTRGIVFAENQGVFPMDGNEHAIETIFKEALGAGCNFLLIGHNDVDGNLHTTIKLYEQRYGIITECVNFKTMLPIVKENKVLAMENIVAKANLKLGGLNYDIKIEDPNFRIAADTLFIGFGLNHPTGDLKRPSVLGFAANDGEHPNEFIGNFFFQNDHRDDKVSVLDYVFEEVIGRYLKNRNKTPHHIVIYRNGCSEGQFGQVLATEIPVYKNLIERHANGAYLSIILPSKNHSVRFFNDKIVPNSRPVDQNIRPGFLADSSVVNPAFNEFYLNSHLAIQGTAKTPKYTVLYTDYPKVTLADFQRWTHALCFNFQIVTSPTSLPAPVYIANRYAERGRDLLNAAELSRLGSNGSNGDQTKSALYNESTKLNYSKMPTFRDKRINA